MGYAHGLDAEFLCYEKRPFTLDEAMALAGPHGVEVRPFPETLRRISPIWRAMDRFGTTTVSGCLTGKAPAPRRQMNRVKISAGQDRAARCCSSAT